MGRLYRITVIFFLFIPCSGWSQSMDCEQTIALATEEFNAGHFYSVPGILKECLNSFSREQKQRAYLLLTQTYLLLDDPIGAETSFLEVLAANPEFLADEQLHPIDIVYLSKRFTATPKFSWFVGGGTNVSPVRVILDNGVTSDGGEKYRFLPGYNFGAGGEYSYNDNIRFRLEVNYLHTAYQSLAEGHFQSALYPQISGDKKTVQDRQSWVTLPLYVTYADNTGPYRPYFYAGYSISKLFGDKASISIERVIAKEEEGETETESLTVESADFDFKLQRMDFNHSIIFGGGVKYKIGLDFVFAELRYSAGLKNIVNTDYVYGDHTLGQTSVGWVKSFTPTSAFGHVDDYMRLDNLAITFGFIRPLYKPRELKRARTKGVLRKMKRSK
jgi:hypothetical protein